MSILGRLFSRDTASSEDAVRTVAHLQKMLAYQQLALETYNDACADATDVETPVFEGLIRPEFELGNPDQVAEIILPALDRKTEIMETMLSEHSSFDPGNGKPKSVYDAFTTALDVMKRRTDLQIEGYSRWLEDPSSEIDIKSLDKAELSAMDRALGSLNSLIGDLGIDGDKFLEIVAEAFNAVRRSVGMDPLAYDDFCTTYMAGLMGQPARFFSDQ